MADESAINLNKPSLAPTNNENEQNGSRNDVLVKIGLVGDAQVFFNRWPIIIRNLSLSISIGW